MIENRIHDNHGHRIHTTYGTPPPVGYRFTLDGSSNAHEYVVLSVVPVGARTFHVVVK